MFGELVLPAAEFQAKAIICPCDHGNVPGFSKHSRNLFAGFSQGSVAAALFLAEMHAQKEQLGLKFAILVSKNFQTYLMKKEAYLRS